MRPNILLVVADDLGQGDVSCFNSNSKWTTNSLDLLAAEGMRFNDAHATSSLCSPSRYSLLTGRYSWRSRLKRSVLPGDAYSLIERDRLTLAGMLQDNGYKTAVVGKWHLGLDWCLRDDDPSRVDGKSEGSTRFGRGGNFDPSEWPTIEGIDIDYSRPIKFGPNQMGFDYSFITAASLDQPPYVYIENGIPLGVPEVIGGDHFQLDRRTDSQAFSVQKGPMVPGYEVSKVPSDFQDRALSTLDSLLAGDDPWFLYVPSHLVHGPIVPGEPWVGSSGMGPYGDFVLQFDAYVGQLVDRIDAAGARDDTIVVVTSDNGPSGVAGLDSLKSRGHDSANGWRGVKSDIWEGGHREPYIVRWPGKVEAGTASDGVVSLSDLFATFAEIIDVTIPEDVAEDSISSASIWFGDHRPVRDHIVSQSGGGALAIRSGLWKLEFTTTGDGMDARYEAMRGGIQTEYVPAQLYHLGDDPGEQNNVIDSHPELVEEMSYLLADFVRRGRSTPGAPLPNDYSGLHGEWPQIDWMPDAVSVRDHSRRIPD